MGNSSETMRKIKIGFVSGLLALVLVNQLYAQRLCINTAVGIANYSGDLATGYTPSYKQSISLGASFDITNRFRFRANITNLSVQGDDSKSPTAGIPSRNLNFKTNITEVGLLGEFDFLDNIYNDIIPYVFLGPSVYHFNPKPLNGPDVNLHDVGTEGQNLVTTNKYAGNKYNLTQLNVQLGAGIRYELSEDLSVSIEGSFRKLFTDYLDDVSSNSYISFTNAEWNNEIARNPSAALTRQLYFRGNSSNFKATYPRGNPNKNDAYYTFQIRLNFRLNNLFMGNDFYSPSNTRGTGQLRCSRRVY